MTLKPLMFSTAMVRAIREGLTLEQATENGWRTE